MQTLTKFINEFLSLTARMAPWLLLGFLFAGLFALFFTPEKVRRHLGGKGLLPVLKAVLLGVPLPLCSCGVVPLAAAMRSSGASRGATAAFFISTPQTGIDSMVATFSLLGWLAGVLRPVLAIVTGLVGGVLIGRLADRDDSQDSAGIEAEHAPAEHGGCCCSDEGTVPAAHRDGDGCCSDEGKPAGEHGGCCCSGGGGTARRPGLLGAVRYMLWYGFVRTPRMVASSLLLGLVIATLIQMFVPDDFGASVIRGNAWVEMVAVIAFSLPLYVCSTGAIPIAATLVLKGISPGAALVFLIAGPATNSAMVASMVRILGGRATLVYLAVLAVVTVTAGVVINALGLSLGGGTVLPTAAAGHDACCLTLFQRLSGAVLLVLLGWGMYRKLLHE